MTLKVTGHMNDKCVLFTPLKNSVIRTIISRASTLVLIAYALRPHPRHVGVVKVCINFLQINIEETLTTPTGLGCGRRAYVVRTKVEALDIIFRMTPFLMVVKRTHLSSI